MLPWPAPPESRPAGWPRSPGSHRMPAFGSSASPRRCPGPYARTRTPGAGRAQLCVLDLEEEGGGPGPAGWDGFPFPFTPTSCRVETERDGCAAAPGGPARRTLADASSGQRIPVGVVKLRVAASHFSLQQLAVNRRQSLVIHLLRVPIPRSTALEYREKRVIPKEQQCPNRPPRQPAFAEAVQQTARQPRRLDTRPQATSLCPQECADRKLLLPPATPTA